jgi:hypothetical protein
MDMLRHVKAKVTAKAKDSVQTVPKPTKQQCFPNKRPASRGLIIYNYFPPKTAALALTSHNMQKVIGTRCMAEFTPLEHRERKNFLFLRSKDLPDHISCFECHFLHNLNCAH